MKIVLSSVVSIVALGIVALLIRVYAFPNTGQFTLINKTSEPITLALVEICGQTIELKDIRPAGIASGAYKVKGDSHYTIQVEFPSGKKLQKETGYVTSGMNYHDEITVTESGIEITKTETK